MLKTPCSQGVLSPSSAMMQPQPEQHWIAVRTGCRRDKRMGAPLERETIHSFPPWYRSKRKQADQNQKNQIRCPAPCETVAGSFSNRQSHERWHRQTAGNCDEGGPPRNLLLVRRQSADRS